MCESKIIQRKAIIENSNNYELPIDSLPISIIVCRWDNDDFIIIDINKYAQEHEEMDKDFAIDRNFCGIFLDSKTNGLFDVLKRVYKSGEKEIYNSNLFIDSHIHGWRKNEVIKLSNGDLMIIYQDISKETNLEKILKDVSQFIDNSQTIIFFWRAEEGWPVEYLSSNISDFGYTKNDFLSHRLKYQDIIHKDDVEQVFKEVAQYAQDEVDSFKQIYRIMTADGEARWIDDRTFVKRDKYGVIKNYLGTITDITESIEIQHKLKESEEKFHAIAENSLMGIFIYQDGYNYVNPAISEMTGYTAEELYKMSPLELVEDKIKPAFSKTIKRRLNGEKFPKSYNDIKIVAKDGSIKIGRMMTETIEYGDGYAGLGTVIDITDVTESSSRLKMLAQAIEQTDELVMITDKHGVITYVNEAYIIHSGYRHDQLLGKKAGVVKSDKQVKEFYHYLWDIISSGETFSNTIIHSKKDNRDYHLETTITPIFNAKDEITNYVSTSKDITQRIKLEEELYKRANYDSLTELYNRYSGNEILDAEIDKFQRYNTSFAVLMLDIDFFKNINDTYGHDVGDAILRQLSQLIKMHMRKSDHLVRWGGEEFIIISELLDARKARTLATKLKSIISSYEFENGLSVTVSFGVGVMEENDTKQTLLKRVDDALYHAKAGGRNCVKFL